MWKFFDRLKKKGKTQPPKAEPLAEQPKKAAAIPVPWFKFERRDVSIPYPISFKRVPKVINIPTLTVEKPGMLKSITEQTGGFFLFVFFSLIGLIWLVGTYL